MIEVNEFKEMLSDKKNELINEEKNSSLLSAFRVFSFLTASLGIIIGIVDNNNIVLGFGIVSVFLFVILIFVHGKVINKIEFIKNYILVIQRYIDRYSDAWRDFQDNGEEYCKDTNSVWDMVARDLDMLGSNSLYQMINVCNTTCGKDKLASTLKQKEYSITEIEERQNAILQLNKNIKFALEFESYGMKLQKKGKKFNFKEFILSCTNNNTIPIWIKIARFFLPILEAVLTLLWVLGVISYAFPLASVFIGVAVTWFAKRLVDERILPLFDFAIVIEDYRKIFELITKLDAKNGYLQNIISKVTSNNGALNAIIELNKISGAYNVCFNPLIHFVLNGTITWDFHLMCKVEKWKAKYGEYTDEYFDAIGQIEELLSLGVLGVVRDTCKALVSDNANKEAIFNDIKHPLLLENKVVPNDISLKENLYIITGSNMSGKTTFLRTVAVNLCLAFVGAPVCAKHLNADYKKIFTSMRVTDDVSNGISTFYAEILRIKCMSEYKKTGKPMICFIDEIFKGTNSADRIVGATEVITKLSNDNCITLVSTHDFELCDIKGDDSVKTENYHFEEYYENQELKFDYKIKNGRCTTTNAMFLIKMAGF